MARPTSNPSACATATPTMPMPPLPLPPLPSLPPCQPQPNNASPTTPQHFCRRSPAPTAARASRRQQPHHKNAAEHPREPSKASRATRVEPSKVSRATQAKQSISVGGGASATANAPPPPKSLCHQHPNDAPPPPPHRWATAAAPKMRRRQCPWQRTASRRRDRLLLSEKLLQGASTQDLGWQCRRHVGDTSARHQNVGTIRRAVRRRRFFRWAAVPFCQPSPAAVLSLFYRASIAFVALVEGWLLRSTPASSIPNTSPSRKRFQFPLLGLILTYLE